MSEGPSEQYADMPAVVLRYECTMKAPGNKACAEPAKYIVRGHKCGDRLGQLYAACQAHVDEWQDQEYPVRCGGCRYAFNGPLDIIWEVCEL